MAIDAAIKYYENMKKGWYLVHPERLFDFTIDILRKYQQIEQIYQKYNEVNDFSYNQAMRKIGEVLQDGK